MKILGIKFKNISAMRGEWEIRFDQPPLADTDLFAIVGPKGSGKTTILDALTLALYGETPRLKNPEQAIINWQEPECFSEVTFAVSGSVYRSRWSARKIAGDPEAPEMALTSLNGGETTLEDRVIRVRERVAELTGLDFKRFCRSILLAQGEFTAFLTALESERAEILEKIIGPEMAREMADSIRTKAETENERLLQLKETAASLPLLDKSRQNELREALEQAREDLHETDRQLEELDIVQEWYQRVELLEKAQHDATEALAAAETRYAQTEADLQALERAKAATPFREEVSILDGLQAEAERAKSQFNLIETDIRSYQERMAELEGRLRDNRSQLEEARKQLEGRSADMNSALQLDRNIAEIGERFRDAVSQYETLEKAQKDNLQQQADIDRQIADLQRRCEELNQRLEANARDSGLESDIPIIEEILTRLNAVRQQRVELKPRETEAVKAEKRSARMLRRAERAALWVERKTEKLDARKSKRDERLGNLLGEATLESLLADYQSCQKGLKAFKKLIKIEQKYRKLNLDEDTLKTLAQIQSEQDKVNESLALEQEQLAAMQAAIGWRDTVRKYAPERAALKSEQPCPLCGALDHPFVLRGVPDFDSLDSTWQDRQAKIAAMQRELQDLNTKAAAFQSLAKVAETIHGEWSRVCAQAGGEWPITDRDSLRDELQSRKIEMRILRSRIRAVRWQSWRAARAARALQRKLDKLSSRTQHRDRLHADHDLHHQVMTDLKSERQRLRQDEDELKAELAQRLSGYGESMHGLDAQTDPVQRLRTRWENYRRQQRESGTSADLLQSLQQRKESLPKELSQLQGQAGMLALKIQASQEELATLQGERESLFGAFDPLRERQDLESQVDLHNAERMSLKQEAEFVRRALVEKQPHLPEAEREALKAQMAVEETEPKILALSVAAGFDSVDTLRACLLLLDQEEAIAGSYANAQKDLAEAKSGAELARDKLDSVRSERVVAGPLPTVQWKIADANKRRDAIQAEIEMADRTLQEQRDMEREYRDILRTIAEQEKISAHAAAEQAMLESHDPAKGKKKLHRLMLEQLVEKTNQHLEVLSGRYYLQPSDEEGLGLEIEDRLQGRTHRAVKTLSGGESFLASLCLALGLSEMACNGRKIESLFLDEGFGSLDDEMLYRVMAALKGLRANGKMVGVISHVKRLAEEIPTQIRVEKQPGGSSRITIVA